MNTPFTSSTRPRSVRPGGNSPKPYPMNEAMFGSLIVHAARSQSASSPAARWQKAANRSAVPGSAHPPRSATHRGVVKWWKVTTGSMPRSSSASHCRR